MGKMLKLLCKVEGPPLWKGYYYGKPGMAAIYGGRVDGPAVGWGSQVYSLSCSGKLFTLLWWWWIIDIDDQVHPFFPKLQSIKKLKMYVMGRMRMRKNACQNFFEWDLYGVSYRLVSVCWLWSERIQGDRCGQREEKAGVSISNSSIRWEDNCWQLLIIIDNCWQLLTIVNNCWQLSTIVDNRW